MLIETLSVREAREQLPRVLERFRNGDRTPVGVGSHRKTEAVMVPVEVFDELTAERARRWRRWRGPCAPRASPSGRPAEVGWPKQRGTEAATSRASPSCARVRGHARRVGCQTWGTFVVTEVSPIRLIVINFDFQC
jgi:hypothetical protein